jgi:hypothetical protein
MGIKHLSPFRKPTKGAFSDGPHLPKGPLPENEQAARFPGDCAEALTPPGCIIRSRRGNAGGVSRLSDWWSSLIKIAQETRGIGEHRPNRRGKKQCISEAAFAEWVVGIAKAQRDGRSGAMVRPHAEVER